MSKLNFTNIVLVIFSLYIINCLYVFYILFNPPSCIGDGVRCLRPKYRMTGKSNAENLMVSLYTSHKSRTSSVTDLDQVWQSRNVLNYQKNSFNISLPRKTRRNGTLFGYAFVHPVDRSPFDSHSSSILKFEISQYSIPKDQIFNLLSETKTKTSQVPITHIKANIILHVLVSDVSFERMAIPAEIYRSLQVTQDGFYLPMLHYDTLSATERFLRPVNESTKSVEVLLEYKPVSIGRLRLWMTVEQSLSRMKEFGFTDKDMNELKGIFTDTNLYFLGLTFAISVLHLLFDFLAFKNDINFWKNKKSMEGLSLRVVLWRCCSTAIIFLYLLDEKTSLLVLVPAGIGSLIEFWKVSRALKVEVTFGGGIFPRFKLGEKSASEQETESHDSEAMKYLSFLLYPLLTGGAIYSLIYYPHKSWYSWVVRSLVNGVYAFGFLFMLPQLFVNYKLKSVAHLPWKAFMYKAFNTFIDDIFAFIITMPTAHRLACFRDDVVFMIYLYQRWLYPIDKSRVNEFGMSYEDQKEKKE
ncbi:lipid scramblase CLPTM1L-like [Rhopilema esculentum]|uniref:lipid scramblase CLPTM1L-like n=1 Tax=Rhopilema esculentum TaxID=499914 RepID=UPI0031E23891